MATNTAEFILKLKEEMSGGVESAAQALTKLKDAIAKDTSALSDMQKAMRNLKQAGAENTDQFKQLKAAVDAKRGSIGQLQSAYIELGGTFGKAKEGTRSLQSRLAELSKQSAELPGPLGAIGSAVSKLAQSAGGFGALAVVGGLLAIGVAAGAATKALLEYGIASQDARRDELLHLEGLAKMRTLFAGAGGNAKQMQSEIDRIAASSSLGREEIASLNDELYKMGLRGKNLSSALEGTAIKTAVQGKAAGSAFANWAAGAAFSGQAVQKLTDRVKSQLGGVAQKQMSSLTVQAKKQREAYGALFTNIEIEPFLDALKTVRDLFGQGTAAGQAMKAGLTAFMQPLIDDITAALPLARLFFKGVLHGVLQMEIAFLELRNWWNKTFGTKQKNDVDSLQTAFDLGRDAVTGLAGALGALAALFAGKFAVSIIGTLARIGARIIVFAAESVIAMAPLIAEFAVMAAPFILAAAAVFGLFKILQLLFVVWNEIDWTDLGRNIWKGIVGGISSGYKAVKDAVGNLAESAWTGLKEALQISSPSKVFAELGTSIPAGVTQGIDQGSPAVSDAAAELVKVPAPVPAAGGGGGGAAASSGGHTITIGEIVINTSSDKPKDLAAAFRRELESVLEVVALQLGTPPAGAT